MRTPHTEPAASLVVARDQPVVAIPLIEDGREVVQSAVEADTGTPATLPDSVRDALSLAGAWGDLDWDDTVEALDRIRHPSSVAAEDELAIALTRYVMSLCLRLSGAS